MAATHAQPEPDDVIGPAPAVDDMSMEPTPGVRAAMLLFDRGLWFEAVVRGLRAELEFSDEAATRAATAAAALRLK
jgi:hypothetical protein